MEEDVEEWKAAGVTGDVYSTGGCDKIGDSMRDGMTLGELFQREL